MRFGSVLIVAALAVGFTTGCQKSSGLTSPGALVPGAIELTGTVLALSNGHPYDGDYVLTLQTAPGKSREAYVEARLQITPEQLPFDSDTPLDQLAVGDRVRVRGVPRGERVRMFQLRRLAR